LLAVRNVTAEYSNARGTSVQAARNISFEVAKGRLFTLLGPSGCGKTTTLRSIAGLEHPVTGEIEAGGRIVFSSQRNIFVALNKRNFGMVFQSYAIWPHMTVLQNASFPLEVRGGLSRKTIRDRAMRVLDTVAMSEFAEREATKLSGGQQQRLALARALVMEPDLLLLDEPLSNLDAKLRERMRLELKRIQRELSITTVYVTHDQAEALALSDEIAVMNEGRIVQIGNPCTIYERPRDRFVAGFIGNCNFIEAEVLGPEVTPGLWCVRSELGDLKAISQTPLFAGSRVTLAVRPENLELLETAPADSGNVIRAIIETRLFQGDFIEVQLRPGNLLLTAHTHPAFRSPEGDAIFVRIAPENCVILVSG
jgi:iron(III) transport system ATP-binding protein